MRAFRVRFVPQVRQVFSALAALLVAGALSAASLSAQNVDWAHWGNEMSATRSSPLDQINADNFENLQVAWTWRADNFGPSVDFINRAIPIYVNGKVYTHAGRRRTVAAIDPVTGETLWTFREPHTERWERSTRQNWGKGVAYGEIDGRGVIYMTSPGYFLHALDADTGLPLEGFGHPIDVPGFGEYGAVDMLRYVDRVGDYDPYFGPDPADGFITTSTPPMVVDGVVIVGSAFSDGGAPATTRNENLPGDILAFDARTGALKWKFHTIPRPGEFGHDTWGDGSWEYTGATAAWAPISADPELGLVFMATETPTNDYYGGHRPGDNLFGNSVLALDIQTGERRWHYQLVRNDIWDWDLPFAPMLVDLNVNGQQVPSLVQITKHTMGFAFNRVTGEPVHPIELRPVPPSPVPGEQASPVQPFPVRPAAWEIQGISEDDLIDFTPELRRMALEAVEGYHLGPMFTPHFHRGNDIAPKGSITCPSATGGTNISGGAALDAQTGIMYVSSVKRCSVRLLYPGTDLDDGSEGRIGRTIADWQRGETAFPNLNGLPILKPPYGRITAIDMNTGETLWWIPNGDTPENIKNHPLLAGVDLPNTGQSAHAHPLVTGTLMIYGEGRGGRPYLHAVDKLTGETLASIELPASTSSQPITYMHEGVQYLLLSVAGGGHPASHVALRLPDNPVQ
jgi:glucose dehydrogenase